jgi:hypothetical protein
MVALLALSRDAVDNCYASAMASVARSEGPPGLRPHIIRTIMERISAIRMATSSASAVMTPQRRIGHSGSGTDRVREDAVARTDRASASERNIWCAHVLRGPGDVLGQRSPRRCPSICVGTERGKRRGHRPEFEPTLTDALGKLVRPVGPRLDHCRALCTIREPFRTLIDPAEPSSYATGFRRTRPTQPNVGAGKSL